MQKTLKAVYKLHVNIIKSLKQFNKDMKKIFIFLCAFICTLCCTSCNVTRVMTNESQYFQRGDTAVVIQTKTTETYNAEKKGQVL